jgi:hypothetical protein
VALLAKADWTRATSLKVLLDLTSRSASSATATSTTDRKHAGRAAAALVRAARAIG